MAEWAGDLGRYDTSLLCAEPPRALPSPPGGGHWAERLPESSSGTSGSHYRVFPSPAQMPDPLPRSPALRLHPTAALCSNAAGSGLTPSDGRVSDRAGMTEGSRHWQKAYRCWRSTDGGRRRRQLSRPPSGTTNRDLPGLATLAPASGLAGPERGRYERSPTRPGTGTGCAECGAAHPLGPGGRLVS